MPFDDWSRDRGRNLDVISRSREICERSNRLCRQSAALCRQTRFLVDTARREQRSRRCPDLWSLYYDGPTLERPGGAKNSS